MMNQNRDFLVQNCLSLNNVSAGTRLLPFSAQVNRGALIHIIGPNGAGKSTLLSRIAGILPGDGTIMLNQIDIENSLRPSWHAIAPIYISNNSPAQ